MICPVKAKISRQIKEIPEPLIHIKETKCWCQNITLSQFIKNRNKQKTVLLGISAEIMIKKKIVLIVSLWSKLYFLTSFNGSIKLDKD